MASRRQTETKEEYNARMNEYMKSRYKVTVKWIQDYKEKVGCTDCGKIGHHAGFQFDHLESRNNDRQLTIAYLATRGLNVVKREIEKCEVVCGYCHGIRTWNRKQNSS